MDGRTFFATQYVVAKFKKLKIEPCEKIALCMQNIDGKSITLVERVPEPTPPPEPIVITDAPPATDQHLQLRRTTFVLHPQPVSLHPRTTMLADPTQS